MRNRSSYKNSISCRLIGIVILISSVVTVVITGIQLSIDYQDEMSEIEYTFSLLQKSYLESLAQAVWEYHDSFIDLQLDGMMKLPYVSYVQVSSGGHVQYSKGLLPPEGKSLSKTYTLPAPSGDPKQVIGTLAVYLDTTPFWSRFEKKLFIILFSQFLKTLIVSALILWAFRAILIRHLLRIAEYLSNLDVTKQSSSLSLTRRGEFNDELEFLVTTINAMKNKLTTSYHNLSRLNKDLDTLVHERSQRLEATTRDLTKAAEMAGMAHLASNVLQNVKDLLPNFVDTVTQSLKSSQEESVKELQYLHRQIEHVTSIVNSQNGFTTVVDCVEERFIHDLIDEAVRFNRENLEKSRIKVRYDIQRLPPLELDRHKVVLILTNLIRHAQDSITECNAERKEIIISASMQNGSLRISVRDSGPGISKEVLPHLFKPSLSASQVGNRFGLYSAALAAHALQGKLTALSDGIGQGAEFILEFKTPTQPCPIETTTTASEPQSPPALRLITN